MPTPINAVMLKRLHLNNRGSKKYVTSFYPQYEASGPSTKFLFVSGLCYF